MTSFLILLGPLPSILLPFSSTLGFGFSTPLGEPRAHPGFLVISVTLGYKPVCVHVRVHFSPDRLAGIGRVNVKRIMI